MTQLELNNVHAGYGNFLVLKGVDMCIDQGDIVCLIGPNGAGKSTTFKCIYNLLPLNKGSITFKGEDTTPLSRADLLDRGISYVLQRDGIFPDMTVKENLELGAYTADADFDVAGKIAELYELFPAIEEKSSQKAGALSGGQRQMVELARGLMLDPELLLLDEPTAGLAPKIIDDVMEKIVGINERGVTILMVEQNVKTGLKYSDYTYVLENGQTVFSGDSESVLDQPEIREAYLGRNIED